MHDVPPDMMSSAKEAIDKFKTEHGHEILFANISGAHLFGTASERSDVDLRGCYIVPTSDLLRFSKPRDTIELSAGVAEIQFHEAEKFLSLMVKGNMNFIEEVKSPLRVVDTPVAEDFRRLADLSLSKETFRHVQGMSIHTKKHGQKENFTSPKRNLYLLRELLRGIILFRDGTFESDVSELANLYGDAEITELTEKLVELKRRGSDYEQPPKFKGLIAQLENEMLRTKEFGTLRARPSGDVMAEAERLLVRMRMERLKTSK